MYWCAVGLEGMNKPTGIFQCGEAECGVNGGAETMYDCIHVPRVWDYQIVPFAADCGLGVLGGPREAQLPPTDSLRGSKGLELVQITPMQSPKCKMATATELSKLLGSVCSLWSLGNRSHSTSPRTFSR